MSDGQSPARSTISLADSVADGPRVGVSRVRLTILFHPDIRRIGEVAELPDRAELSRHAPLFASPRSAERPLDDPVLSRRPIVLQRLPTGGCAIEPAHKGNRLELAGERVRTPCSIAASDLRQGVVLTVARRVVLLWQLTTPEHAGGTPDAPQHGSPDDMGMLGVSPALAHTRSTIRRIARMPVPVCIRGESGVGKELVARAIHRHSDRCGRPFVCVNMAAIPPSTAVSELFGHERGAFTGASGKHEGYFGQADGGTLFLDEIGEAPGELQAMLLRALEANEIRPLGSKRPRRVDVRVVTATDADLEAAVARGQFRLALLHRLAAVQLRVPPLRQRRADIGLLAVHFLKGELDALGDPGRLDMPSDPSAPTWLPPRVVAGLTEYSWPGNVRQLRNVARQIAVGNAGRTEFFLPDDIRALLDTRARTPAAPTKPEVQRASKVPVPEDRLLEALRAHDWRPEAAARALGIGRASVYRMIQKSPNIRTARDLSAADIAAGIDVHGRDLAVLARGLEVSRRGLQLRLAELKMKP